MLGGMWKLYGGLAALACIIAAQFLPHLLVPLGAVIGGVLIAGLLVGAAKRFGK